jgi:predicted chitinase
VNRTRHAAPCTIHKWPYYRVTSLILPIPGLRKEHHGAGFTGELTSLVPVAHVLLVLLLCALMGLLGQGVRAVVGRKGGTLNQSSPNKQSEFNAAYLAFSLMLGAIAGILAGLVIGLQNFNANDIKTLLGIAASGYAGADFIESTYSLFFTGPGGQQAEKSSGAAASTADAQTIATHLSNLNAAVSSLAVAVSRGQGTALDRTAPPAAAIHGLSAALSTVAPHLDASLWLSPLSAAFTKYSMATNKRMAAAVGQFLVEAGSSFQELVENLYYTTASRLVQVFPREFPTEADAQSYLRNPEALANRVYANKLGNGDEASGDGCCFCGRGLIQLTGRNEYTQFGATVGMTAEQASQYLETPAGAAMSGCWYLSANRCLPFADAWNISEITRLVNGSAMESNAQRIAYSNAMLQALDVSSVAARAIAAPYG